MLRQAVLFDGDDASGDVDLWETNGTTAGTYELTGISGAYSGGLFIYSPFFTVFNGEVLFEGADAGGHAELWVTDGTSAGTHEVTGISGAGTGGLFNGGTPGFAVYNGEVLFDGTDASGNNNLWVTNGTAIPCRLI
jgi:ELWxxDGT repeat protein